MTRTRAPRIDTGTLRVTRRQFGRGLGAVALGAALPLRGFAEPELRRRAQARPRMLVFVHLRGGADGLSLLVPEGDLDYARLRPRTRAELGAGERLELEPGFALPSAAAALGPFVRARELSAWPALGFRARPRSHGEAEARLFAAIAARVADSRLQKLDARSRPFPGWSLAAQLEHVADRINGGAAPAVAWVEHPGWDTHAAQRSRVHEQIVELCQALAGFRASLGARADAVAIAVASEFGRSLCENTTSGTDDGHAGVGFVLARDASESRIRGRWPGLANADPHRLALPPTTDLERWIAALLARYVAPDALRRGARA